MKKIFFSFAVCMAIFLIVSCGGSDGGGGESGGYGSSECDSDYDSYKCSNSSRYVCLNGSWSLIENCPYGCDYSTPSFRCNSGGGNGGVGGSSECSSGDRKCSGSSSYYCSGGSWEYDEYCSNGCDSSTGRCKSSSGGGSSSECSNGEYQCSGVTSYRCSGGKWVVDQECINSGVTCNDATGKCRTKDEISPCPPKLSASVSGSNVKLSWSYSTSSGCGTPTTATLKVYDGESTWDTVESKNASSFTSYTLPVSVWGYYLPSAGQTLVRAGIGVENEIGQASASCTCFIDDKNCSCI